MGSSGGFADMGFGNGFLHDDFFGQDLFADLDAANLANKGGRQGGFLSKSSSFSSSTMTDADGTVHSTQSSSQETNDNGKVNSESSTLAGKSKGGKMINAAAQFHKNHEGH